MKTRRVALVAAAASLAFSGCSKPATSTEIVHRAEGDLDAKISVSRVKPTTRVGTGWIANESIDLDVKRGRWFLDSPGTRCAVADQRTVELRLAGTRSLLAYRCKPSEAWVVAHIGETGVHVDCEANGGAAAEPDLSTTKTFLERVDVLARCAVDESLSRKKRDNAMRYLAIDVGHATNSDARTAEVLLRFLDELRVKKVDAVDWLSAIWRFELNQGIVGAERFTLAPTVYPELQRQSVARLATATAPDEIYVTAAIADGHDPKLADAATNALKPLVALPSSGRNDATIAVLLGPLLTTAPDRAAKLGCDVLRAGLMSGTAALATAKSNPACPAVATAVRALPDYSKKWLDERCAAPQVAALTEFPTQILDDAWRRKALEDAAFRANPHDFVPWQEALVTAACPHP